MATWNICKACKCYGCKNYQCPDLCHAQSCCDNPVTRCTIFKEDTTYYEPDSGDWGMKEG